MKSPANIGVAAFGDAFRENIVELLTLLVLALCLAYEIGKSAGRQENAQLAF